MNRVRLTKKGKLEEIVTDGGASFGRVSRKGWFLECTRKDGSSVVVWIDGKVRGFEERPPSKLATGEGG